MRRLKINTIFNKYNLIKSFSGYSIYTLSTRKFHISYKRNVQDPFSVIDGEPVYDVEPLIDVTGKESKELKDILATNKVKLDRIKEDAKDVTLDLEDWSIVLRRYWRKWSKLLSDE